MKFRAATATALVAAACICTSVYATERREAKEQMKIVQQSCQEETKNLCPGKSGKDRMACLNSNADKLGTTCKDILSKSAPAK